MAFSHQTNFGKPLDEMWEVIPGKDWSFDMQPGIARMENRGDAKAEIYLRPCSSYGDRMEFQFTDDSRSGLFTFGFIASFEFITFTLNFSNGEIEVLTHEFHKEQPRCKVRIEFPFSTLAIVREECKLSGLPYEGSKVSLYVDQKKIVEVDEIDFLPECHCQFGLWGKGEFTLSSFSLSGPARPRPEYVHVGVWQQSVKETIAENVDSLIQGVKEAATAGVEILVTPETSLTGLRPKHPELDNRDLIQSELQRFQKAVAEIKNAPYTLTGYPEWVDGSEVDGSTLEKVKINCHRFIRPDGSLGPMMAKVHSCEEGIWHGRSYNLQRVCGVEVVLGVCHDVRYQDVWATGVMGGARLCLHVICSGDLSGEIPILRSRMGAQGQNFDAYWVRVNAKGGAAIVYPQKNAKISDTLLAVPKDLTKESPTYPTYTNLGNQLAHCQIRLWDALGCYPMRTLRSGSKYKIWKQLIPEIINVQKGACEYKISQDQVLGIKFQEKEKKYIHHNN